MWIQSFETGVLRRLRPLTPVRLLHRMTDEGRPADVGADGPTYAAMREPAGLARIAEYADAIGVPKHLVLGEGGPKLVRDAHAAGLEVHVWTLRAENHFLSKPFRGGGGDAARGDAEGEARAILDRCVDALFADHPFPAVRARDTREAALRSAR